MILLELRMMEVVMTTGALLVDWIAPAMEKKLGARSDAY